jgi:hypothetical protein
MSKERVLVIPTKSFLEIGSEMRYNQFEGIMNKESRYMDRDLAEKDENFLQIIPYCIIFRFTTTMNEPSMFLYQRLKGGSEARLHAKYSIGIGGHIDEERDHHDCGMESLKRGAYYEIKEEIGASAVYPPTIASKEFLVYDPSNEVGRVHLGVLMKAWARSDDIQPKETNKIAGGMVSLSRIEEDPKISENLENWSKIALNLCFTKTI